MTAAALSAPPVAATWFKATTEFWRLPQCVQRLWEWVKHVKHRGATRFKIKDWQLAEEMGVGRACVQKALRWAERLGLIRRYRVYGRDHGRVIEIVFNLVGPKPKAKPATKAQARAKGGNAQPATPEEQAAAKAAVDAAAAESDYVPTPEEEEATKAWLEQVRAKAAAAKIPCGRERPRISEEELERRRAASRARTADIRIGPDGMRIPATPPDT